MSHEALGDQFADHLRVYRGLEGVAPHEVGPSLGNHWSHSPEVAYNFAQGTPTGWASDAYFDDEGDERRSGTVIAGLVHPDHVVKPGSKEHQSWRDFDQVQDEGSHEEEATVRPDSPVHVIGMSHIKYGGEQPLEESYEKFDVPKRFRA